MQQGKGQQLPRERIIRGKQEFLGSEPENGYEDLTQDELNEWMTKKIIRLEKNQMRIEDGKPASKQPFSLRKPKAKQPYEDQYDPDKQPPPKKKPAIGKTLWILIGLILTGIAIWYVYQITFGGMTINF